MDLRAMIWVKEKAWSLTRPLCKKTLGCCHPIFALYFSVVHTTLPLSLLPTCAPSIAHAGGCNARDISTSREVVLVCSRGAEAGVRQSMRQCRQTAYSFSIVQRGMPHHATATGNNCFGIIRVPFLGRVDNVHTMCVALSMVD